MYTPHRRNNTKQAGRMGESIGVPVRSCMGCEYLLIPIYQRTSHGTRPYVHSHPSLRLSDRSSACLPTPLVGGSDFMRVMAVPKQHSRTSAIPRPHASMSNTEFNSCASPVPSLVPLTLTPSHQHTPAFSVPVTTLAPSEYLPIRSLFRDPKGRHIIATPPSTSDDAQSLSRPFMPPHTHSSPANLAVHPQS